MTERNFDSGFESFRNLRAGPTDHSKSSDGGFDFADLMYDFRERMRNYSSVLNPYTLPYVSYRYLQHLRDWPTIPGEKLTEAFVEDLKNQSEPFFAWTHFMDLHAPLNPRLIREGGLCASDRIVKHLLWDAARAGRVHEPRYDTMYDSALRYVDRCIGSVVEHLKAQDQWDDTVLIVTGDHGEVLFDRDGVYGHPRHHLYDDLLHVPLLVRIPGEDARRVSTPFSLAWLHELIAEVLDLPDGDFPTFSGRESIFDPMDDESTPVISDSIDERGHTVSVRNSQTKLISHAPIDEVDDSSPLAAPDVAFDYVQDPGERVSLDGNDYPDLQDQAKGLHTDPAELSSIDGKFSEDVEQRLKDLGYRT
ncbi:hypothetical protein C489_18761 [Natrinema versiforme JCM 10478]|uniref:Sulfatase N-terminal domain-containing protein n=1 Tax=Natrinema versiforme JCM 10478 TaxID=1227496 RepID=L9XPN0_9EURY|nr:hypothetical protein C489_18761 [Natrinema versiforme JCM 10478]